MTRQDNHYDAIVVGARCAGAATAMLLARSGAKVLCVDYGQPGTDTLSTHTLMRVAVIQLHRWGVLPAIQDAQTPPVRTTRFHYGDEAIDVSIRPAFGTDALFAPRRTILDLALVRAATEASVTFRFGTACVGLVHGADGRVEGARLKGPEGREEVLRAGIVIGADGRRSSVARHVGARTMKRGEHATSTVYGYFDGLPQDGFHWHYAPGAAGGVIPTNDGLSCVFLSLPPSVFRQELRGKGEAGFRATAARDIPGLGRALGDARLASPMYAFAGEPGFMRDAQGPGWALVGDAAYFKDPVTAHGITDALRDAEILADAIIAGSPQDYPAIREALVAEFFRITDEIASFRWSLDEIRTHHVALNTAMKLGQTWILDHSRIRDIAA